MTKKTWIKKIQDSKKCLEDEKLLEGQAKIRSKIRTSERGTTDKEVSSYHKNQRSFKN